MRKIDFNKVAREAAFRYVGGNRRERSTRRRVSMLLDRLVRWYVLQIHEVDDLYIAAITPRSDTYTCRSLASAPKR